MKGIGVLCIVAGSLAGSCSLKSIGRTAMEDAAGRAGGIVLAIGVVLLSVSFVRSAIRRWREAIAARPGFDVVPPRAE